MAQFRVERTTSVPVEATWARLTDWERHGDFIPLTSVTRTGEGAGSFFNARTALGPIGFDDLMEVTQWRPPEPGAAGLCRIEKRGHVITGWAELTVSPTADGTRVSWLEDATIRHTAGVLDFPIRILSARVFGRLIDALLRT
ncbi:MAG: SRPBCC family protein [Propionibacteriales bacterium]|nr:SRPBCC family protein [Propionibacteriales bacterium]